MSTESKTIKTIKGFDSEMKCRGFQYEVGKTYEHDGEISLCESGFHAISDETPPLSVFGFYPPSINGKLSRYCEVEAGGDIETDREKVCCNRLTVGAEIGIPGVVKAHVEWVKKRITNKNNEKPGQAATAGECGAATAGECGAATAGYRGAATAGNRGAATAGEYGAATAGYRGAATAGEYGAATSRGSALVGENGVAVVRGNNIKVRGGLGSLLVIAVENHIGYDIKEWKAVVVDGDTVKADTWYTLESGELKEVK